MARRAVEKPVDILHEELKCSTPPDAASSFAAVLNIIFSIQETKLLLGDRATSKALRLACKPARHVVDAHIITFTNAESNSVFNDKVIGTLHSLSTWPWTNVTNMSIVSPNRRGEILHEEVEHLASLPLLKLKTLTLDCTTTSVLALAHSNWPMLTQLYLTISVENKESLDAIYPPDLQFPTWPLKELELTIRSSGPEDDKPGRLAVLRPFLKSPELNDLKIESGSYSEELATTIVSAPLTKLSTLEYDGDVYLEFFEALFVRDWPALKHVNVPSSDFSILPAMASKSWLRNLETLFATGNGYITVKPLQDVLQAINLGPMKELSLHDLDSSTFVAFRGMKLDHLRLLDLQNPTWETGDGAGIRDATDSINLFFDTCSFPKLERICIGDLQFDQEDGWDDCPYRGDWRRPPSTSVQQLKSVFPLLRCMNLYGLNISRDVADYLGSFRRQTGCELDIKCENRCRIEEVSFLSPNRQRLLACLGLDFKKWKDFCLLHVSVEFYNYCLYWNCLSDVQFKRVAYGAALFECTEVTQLGKFLNFVEAEEDNVLKEGALEALEEFVERLSVMHNFYGLREKMTWENTGLFIDYKQGG